MENQFYSNERAAQLLVSLLKQHNIKRIIASPGSTHIPFLASAMHDSWFEIYSSVDERSAAYMACGMAEETGEPVVITCTGATASRNYMPGLTEAYYRKLPVLAVTASQLFDKIGHLTPQQLDRSNVPNDVVRKSFTVKAVRDADDEWANEIAINNAVLELKRHGGGPVHINLQSLYSRDYSVKDFKPANKIERILPSMKEWPELPKGRIAIFIGSHSRMGDKLQQSIDSFCGEHDSVVLCDHTSNYYGKYRVGMSLPFEQDHFYSDLKKIDLLIHIGEVSGDYPTMKVRPSQVWRVSEDGEIRDTFRKLTKVFEMSEIEFFTHYSKKGGKHTELYQEYENEYKEMFDNIPEIPFSNGWIAQQTAHRIPQNSVVHLGILNSLRNWNYFRFPEGVRTNCNVGGFGIDGIMSTLLGASLSNSNKLYFAIIGDLAFFYDINSLGNRHIPTNIRIMLINNGRGTEFRLYNHPGSLFGDESDKFIAAAAHFGNKSHSLVRHYAEDLGFEYLTASDKNEFEQCIERFLIPEITEKPMLFEVFTDYKDENESVEKLQHIKTDITGKAKGMIKDIMGNKGFNTIKNILGKK